MNIDLRRYGSYDDAVAGFSLAMPERFNVADVLRNGSPDSQAILCVDGRSRVEAMTFGALDDASARAASGFQAHGLGPGSRICVVLPNTSECAVAVLGALRLGGVVAALRPADPEDMRRHQIASIRPDLIVCRAEDAGSIDELAPPGCVVAASLSGEAEPVAEPYATAPSDPAFITFTSGSTGASKAVVLPHSSFLAGVAAFQMFTDLAPEPGDVFFTSAGWGTIGGFRPLVFPAWYFGAPVVAIDGPADGRSVCETLSRTRATVAHVMPQVLRELHSLGDVVLDYDWSALRAIAYAGEPVTAEVQRWIEGRLDVVINPYYGASEIAFVASACRRWFETAPGDIGRRVPGRELVIVDESSLAPVPAATAGMLAVRRSDPGLSLGYLRTPADAAAVGRERGH
jgi:acetyl-CoA synthetase